MGGGNLFYRIKLKAQAQSGRIRMMGKIFVPETEEVTGGSKNHIVRNFMI